MTVDLAMLAPSTLSLCCVAGSRPAWRTLVPAVAMVLAMAMSAVPGRPTWVALVAAAVTLCSAPVVLRRRHGTVHVMDVHRALSAILMAGLLVGVSGDHMAAMSGQGGHMAGLQAVIVAGIGGYLVFSAVLVVRTVGDSRTALEARIASGDPARVCRRVTVVTLLGVVEVAAMAVSVGWMAAM